MDKLEWEDLDKIRISKWHEKNKFIITSIIL
jgi:hypothetical protein